jgi:hypothetical protein
MSSTKQWQPEHRHFGFHVNSNEEFILKIPFASVYADPIFIFKLKTRSLWARSEIDGSALDFCV